jgi:hypothetical protein
LEKLILNIFLKLDNKMTPEKRKDIREKAINPKTGKSVAMFTHNNMIIDTIQIATALETRLEVIGEIEKVLKPYILASGSETSHHHLKSLGRLRRGG